MANNASAKYLVAQSQIYQFHLVIDTYKDIFYNNYNIYMASSLYVLFLCDAEILMHLIIIS